MPQCCNIVFFTIPSIDYLYKMYITLSDISCLLFFICLQYCPYEAEYLIGFSSIHTATFRLWNILVYFPKTLHISWSLLVHLFLVYTVRICHNDYQKQEQQVEGLYPIWSELFAEMNDGQNQHHCWQVLAMCIFDLIISFERPKNILYTKFLYMVLFSVSQEKSFLFVIEIVP